MPIITPPIAMKPRCGDPLEYVRNWDDIADGKTTTPDWTPCGTVDHIDGNLCHYVRPNGNPDLFIWQFRDTLNRCFRIAEHATV